MAIVKSSRTHVRFPSSPNITGESAYVLRIAQVVCSHLEAIAALILCDRFTTEHIAYCSRAA